ncbi:MAG: hypothetical protein IPO68_06330 [Chitinophagaceae bacterium]|nr:hypothetical protein [Chitinophagaceae bacterium]
MMPGIISTMVMAFYTFKEGSWNNINRYRYNQIDTLLDYVTIAIDKREMKLSGLVLMVVGCCI